MVVFFFFFSFFFSPSLTSSNYIHMYLYMYIHVHTIHTLVHFLFHICIYISYMYIHTYIYIHNIQRSDHTKKREKNRKNYIHTYQKGEIQIRLDCNEGISIFIKKCHIFNPQNECGFYLG